MNELIASPAEQESRKLRLELHAIEQHPRSVQQFMVSSGKWKDPEWLRTEIARIDAWNREHPWNPVTERY